MKLLCDRCGTANEATAIRVIGDRVVLTCGHCGAETAVTATGAGKEGEKKATAKGAKDANGGGAASLAEAASAVTATGAGEEEKEKKETAKGAKDANGRGAPSVGEADLEGTGPDDGQAEDHSEDDPRSDDTRSESLKPEARSLKPAAVDDAEGGDLDGSGSGDWSSESPKPASRSDEPTSESLKPEARSLKPAAVGDAKGGVRCPRCFHRQGRADFCHRCGLDLSREDLLNADWDEIPEDQPEAHARAVEMWSALESKPGDVEAHERFLDHCTEHRLLTFAVRRYREFLSDHPGVRPMIEHRDQAVRKLQAVAMAMLASDRWSEGVARRVQTAKRVLLVVAILLLIAGLVLLVVVFRKQGSVVPPAF